MSGHEPVDFVVGTGPADDVDGDEELAAPQRRWSRAPWMFGAVVVAAVVAAVLVEQHSASVGRPARAAPSTSARAAVFTPPPDVVGVTSPVRVPEGNRSTRPPPVCPSNAKCYSDTGVPPSTLTALRKDFPSAQVTSAAEVLANRTGRFGPDLLFRLVHARAGSVDITVTVAKPRRSDRSAYTFDRTGGLPRSRDTYAGSAFTVTVEIVQDGPKHTPSRAALDRIARDARLVVPQ